MFMLIHSNLETLYTYTEKDGVVSGTLGELIIRDRSHIIMVNNIRCESSRYRLRNK